MKKHFRPFCKRCAKIDFDQKVLHLKEEARYQGAIIDDDTAANKIKVEPSDEFNCDDSLDELTRIQKRDLERLASEAVHDLT